MECKQSFNLKRCNCSYSPCPRKGICCYCIACYGNRRELLLSRGR